MFVILSFFPVSMQSMYAIIIFAQHLCQAIATMAISTPQRAGFVANQTPFTKIASQLANDLSQKSYLE